MSQLTLLSAHPELILGDKIDTTELLNEVKQILDPITKNFSVLDEIYVDGLQPSQVWGQVKLVADGVNDKVLFGQIEVFREKYSSLIKQSSNDIVERDGEQDENFSENDLDEEEIEEDSEEEYFNAVDTLDDEEDVPRKDKFGLNDQFFSIEKFNKDTTEDNIGKYFEEKPDINLLKNVEDDEDLKYNDFYKKQKNSKEKDEDEEVTSKKEHPQPEKNDVDYVPEKDHFGLNDQFFSIDDYNKQVDALEENEYLNNDDDEKEVDLFADFDEDDDDDEEMYTYDDFFKKQVDRKDIKEKKISAKLFRKKENSELDENDYDKAYDSAMADIMDGFNDNSENAQKGNEKSKVNENLSTFEKQQRKLQKEIQELEAESIAEKKWTMKGEVNSKQRDNDTLLEEELEFDRTSKPIPVITQETTESIEDLIKRRIKNEEFDEIPKRIISELNNFKPSKKIQVSEEKSSKSLAELYEDEYLDKLDDDIVDEELKAAHDEISNMFAVLNYELDSLCSAHFVPKPKEKLVDVKVQTSTISMEDSQPLTMSNADTLAPQEIYKSNTKVGKNEVMLRSGVVMSKDELDRNDKQRLRRAKKRKMHNIKKDGSLKKKKVETKQL